MPKHSAWLALRLTPEEKSSLRGLADATGQKMAGVIRQGIELRRLEWERNQPTVRRKRAVGA